MFETVRIGIIGTGWIAEKMAITLQGMGDDVIAYGVASRDADRGRRPHRRIRGKGFRKSQGLAVLPHPDL